jgi:hypothetical protein
MENYNKVTRFEVIDRFGRSYSNWNVENVSFSLQDDGKTLKVFLRDTTTYSYECDI